MNIVPYKLCSVHFPEKSGSVMYLMDTVAPLHLGYKITGRKSEDGKYAFTIRAIPRNQPLPTVGKGKRKREIAYAPLNLSEHVQDAMEQAEMQDAKSETGVYANLFTSYGKPHEKFSSRFAFIKWLEKFLVGAPSGNATNDARTYCVLLLGE